MHEVFKKDRINSHNTAVA